MLMDRQTITVDIAPGSGPIQRIRLSQGDIGRQLGVYIIQNGAAVDCSGYSAHLYVLKPDKNYYEKTCSISSNLISWETAEQETPLAGECKAQIRITSNGMDIGTANFIEAIEATPAAGGTASESLISSMTQYVDAAETAARTAVEAEDTVEGIISTYSGIPGRVTNAENSLAATQDGLAIMANGNTHAAIAAGQAVFVRNHSSLSEGLYWASAAIGTNATLSTSNLTADANGGLNALKAKIGNVGNTDLQAQVTSLNSNIATFSISVPTSGTKLYKNAVFRRIGSLIACVTISGLEGLTESMTNTVLAIPSGFVPSVSQEVVVVSAVSGERYKLNFSNSGNLEVYPYSGISDQHNVIVSFTYPLS